MSMRLTLLAAASWLLSLLFIGPSQPSQPSALRPTTIFETSDNCLACHNGLTLSSGEDVSIGASWRATMMANSSRDPYWQASVRREMLDHPTAAADIEDECSTCHMPMARTQAVANGRKGQVFAHLPIGHTDSEESRLAADGVGCTLCHQITRDKLGTPESFTGGYVVDTTRPFGERPVFGPFEIDKGRQRIMHSSSAFVPTTSDHLQQSEVCATCHTLYTKARGPRGEIVGELPEQMPFLEWRHSAYRNEQSCQSCHMPAVAEKTRIASVLGEEREGLSRHVFRGGNFFVLRMLNKFRSELGVVAPAAELEAAVQTTVQHLQSETASLAIERVEASGGRLLIDVAVRNLSGHKLPTAYPSRRAWIHLTARDRAGRVVFESGAVAPTGQIHGNDNDEDAAAAEPHYREITRADQVQIYESIMVDRSGALTTGLLHATGYRKDNRLLPRGFDKATAGKDIAVHGSAADDPDFSGGGDRVRYTIEAPAGDGPFSVEAKLCFQPISFRWARNLVAYDAPEPRRFVTYYTSMSAASTEILARAQRPN
jgi:cytochrome c551/c552